jgi:YegS/Rv2252/BmrU family lipid kinase
MARGRLLVVVNSNASRVTQTLGGAIVALVAGDFALDIRPSGDREALGELIGTAAADVDAIVIAGGDGTINSALPSLIEAGKPVGILPLGTANDLARTLGIPAGPTEAAEVIIAGRRKKIDVGRVNDVHFVNVASIGLSVEIAERQDPELKRQLGALSYVAAALTTIGQATLFAATIQCGDRREKINAYQIAVGNGVFYGGGMKIAADAAIDNGVLDIYAIKTASIPDLVAMAPAFVEGRHGGREAVTTFRGETARIETARPMPVNTDGEVTTRTPADFSVLRGALEVFAPR